MAAAIDWRDRIVEIKRMRIADIAGHKSNPKKHPKNQADAMTGLLNEVGKADVLKAFYSEAHGGKLTLWDGHLRQGLDPNQEWWVAITDLDDSEANLMLAAFDPIAALAQTDAAALEALLRDVQTGDEALQNLLAEMAEDNPVLSWGENGKSSDRLSGDKKKQIKPVIYVDEVADFEAAILRTGSRNRGEALLTICRFYLEHHAEGQFDIDAKSEFASMAD